MSLIGKLTRVPLRTVWKHEAHDFTVWLEDNIDVLSDALDFNLASVEREKSAGNFNVDLVGEDGSRSQDLPPPEPVQAPGQRP